jgi:hypothetical protein
LLEPFATVRAISDPLFSSSSSPATKRGNTGDAELDKL